MADSSSRIPGPRSGDISPPSTKSSSPSGTDILGAIKSYAVGFTKGNTVDTLGAPVDIINEDRKSTRLNSSHT